MSGLDQIDRDVDVATCGFGIWTGLVRRIRQGPGDFALQTWQADVKTSLCIGMEVFAGKHTVSVTQLDMSGPEATRPSSDPWALFLKVRSVLPTRPADLKPATA